MHVRMMYIEQGREGIPADATPHSIWIMPRTDPTQSMQQISSFLMTLKAAQEEIRGLDPGDFEAFDPPKGTKKMNNGFCLDVGHPDNRRLWVHQVKEKKGSSLYEAAPLDEKLYAIEISWTKAEDCKLGSSVRSMTNDQVQKD